MATAMNIVYKGFGFIRNMYNQLNPATLTGAIDILVVEQSDGTLASSPFHVRFGKLGVLRAKEKLVKITVNEERIPNLHMKLGDQGEAFFLEEIMEEEAIPSGMMTSPLPSRPSTPVGHSNSDNSQENERDGAHSGSLQEEHSKRRRRRKRKRRSLIQQISPTIEDTNLYVDPGLSNAAVNGPSTLNFEVETKEKNVENTHLVEDNRYANCAVPSFRLSVHEDNNNYYDIDLKQDWESDEDSTKFSYRCVQSDSDLPGINTGEADLMSPFSDSEVTETRSQPRMMWDWGKLPGGNEAAQDSSSDDLLHLTGVDEENYNFEGSSFRRISSTPETVETINEDISGKQLGNEVQSTAVTSRISSRSNATTTGLYLDDVLNLAPSEANLYLQTSSSTKGVPKDQPLTNTLEERATTPLGSDIDSGTDCQIQEEHSSESIFKAANISMSLCGFLSKNNDVNPEKFEEKLVNFENYLQNSTSILNDPNLVFKVSGRYMNWQTAAPIVLSLAIFKQPLPQEYIEQLVQSQQPQQTNRLMGWLSWRRSNRTESTGSGAADPPSSPPSPSKNDLSDGKSSHAPLNKTHSEPASTSPKLKAARDEKGENDVINETENEVANILDPEIKRSHSAHDIYSSDLSAAQILEVAKSNACAGKTMRKTTRLTSEQLIALRLKPGANKIMFSVTTQYQGTTRCVATIYLWRWSDKIVVSDIDGTITKSDVFGQILPAMGKDWTHGGVARLYQNIASNGYKFIYVSSRAIGQASMTKGYLNWINQQGVSLPPGPLLLSPTSLMIAFHREVIEKKPEKFKIECLKDIQALFPTNPFVSGFGNKSNDVTAYTAVSIPFNRLFTINHRGELKHEQLQTYTTSYSDLGEMVDNFFPPLDRDEDFIRAHSFSNFTYWKEDVIDLANQIDEFLLA